MEPQPDWRRGGKCGGWAGGAGGRGGGRGHLQQTAGRQDCHLYAAVHRHRFPLLASLAVCRTPVC